MSTDPLRMLNNRLAVLRKHVGEEPSASGSTTLHRAYGRAYLGSCVEYLQYRNEDHAFECFQKMVNVCPGLLTEIDTFYQLGCGDQPKGWMGDLKSLNVKRNSVPLLVMMQSLFSDPGIHRDVWRLRRTASAQAYFALGMLGYNTREFGEARRFLWRAMWNDTRLLWNSQIVGMWTKSLLGPQVIDLLKSIHQRFVPS